MDRKLIILKKENRSRASSAFTLGLNTIIFKHVTIYGQKIFENGGRRTNGRTTDDRRTPDHGHPISSPCEPNGSGELIKNLLL